MCVVSNVGDYWKDNLPPQYPREPYRWETYIHQVTRQEFDELKKEVESLKKLLKAAKQYDEENGEPNCEMDDKVALIKKVAELLDVDMSEIFE